MSWGFSSQSRTFLGCTETTVPSLVFILFWKTGIAPNGQTCFPETGKLGIHRHISMVMSWGFSMWHLLSSVEHPCVHHPCGRSWQTSSWPVFFKKPPWSTTHFLALTPGGFLASVADAHFPAPSQDWVINPALYMPGTQGCLCGPCRVTSAQLTTDSTQQPVYCMS